MRSHVTQKNCTGSLPSTDPGTPAEGRSRVDLGGGIAGLDGAIMEPALMGDAPARPPHVMLYVERWADALPKGHSPIHLTIQQIYEKVSNQIEKHS